MRLDTERMYNVGPGFLSGFYVNYLHGLDFICRNFINKDTKVLELGCYNGISSEIFTEYSDLVTCVDIILQPKMEQLLNRTAIKFVLEDSINFLNSIEVGDFDFIYIDSSHAYENTIREILISYNKLNNGQYISGHDFYCDGVYRAIYDTFEYPDIQIFLDSSWVIKKTESLVLKNN